MLGMHECDISKSWPVLHRGGIAASNFSAFPCVGSLCGVVGPLGECVLYLPPQLTCATLEMECLLNVCASLLENQAPNTSQLLGIRGISTVFLSCSHQYQWHNCMYVGQRGLIG